MWGSSDLRGVHIVVYIDLHGRDLGGDGVCTCWCGVVDLRVGGGDTGSAQVGCGGRGYVLGCWYRVAGGIWSRFGIPADSASCVLYHPETLQ